jgi:branched-chain amino acid transport system permease protein
MAQNTRPAANEAERSHELAPQAVEIGTGAPSIFARLGRVLPRQTLLRHFLLLVLFAVLSVLLLESTDEFTNSQLGQVAFYAIAAGGLTVLTGLNGQISLGHGALMAIGAYITALFLSPDVENPLPLPLILLIATLGTAVVGVIVGIAAARLHGPYLAGATLALAVGLPGLALYFKDTLGGEQGLRVRPPLPPPFFQTAIQNLSGNFGSSTKWLAYIGVACLLITFFLLANLNRSRVGRTWRAVRDQEVAAELAGINLGVWRVVAFVVSAACAGLAGAVLACVLRLAAPGAFTLVLSLSLLTAIVIGGLGSLFGALIGSAILVFLPPYFTDLGSGLGLNATQSAQLAPFIYGLVLVVAMIFAPAGIVGTVRLQWGRLRARRPGRANRG